MQSGRIRNVTLVLAMASMFTSCASAPPSGDTLGSTVGTGDAGSQQATADSQRMTKELAPPSSVTVPGKLPVSEQIIRKPPNELGIIVIPRQEPL